MMLRVALIKSPASFVRVVDTFRRVLDAHNSLRLVPTAICGVARCCRLKDCSTLPMPIGFQLSLIGMMNCVQGFAPGK